MRFVPLEEAVDQTQPAPAPRPALTFVPLAPPAASQSQRQALPPPPVPKEIKAPDGKTYTFPSAEAAEGFNRSLQGVPADPVRMGRAILEYGGKPIAAPAITPDSQKPAIAKPDRPSVGQMVDDFRAWVKGDPSQPAQKPAPATTPDSQKPANAIQAQMTPAKWSAIGGRGQPIKKPESITSGYVAGQGRQEPLPSAERYVVDPKFIQAVETQLNAVPKESRDKVLASMVQRNDAYGRAARDIQGRYQAMDKLTPAAQQVFDPRLEAQAKKLETQGGMDPQSAKAWAAQSLRRGVVPKVLPSAVKDVQAEQAALAAQQVKQEMEGAGFGARVGAEIGTRARNTGIGLAQIYADVAGDNELQKDLAVIRKFETAKGEAIPKGDSIAGQSAQQAIASLGGQAPMMVLGAMTGTALPVLAQMGIEVFSQNYGQGRNAGLKPAEAGSRAGLMATAEIMFGRYGLGDQLKALRGVIDRIPTKDLSGYLTASFLKEIPAEQATTLSQFLVDKLPGLGLNQNAGLKDLLEQSAETLRQTVIQAGASNAAIYGASKAERAYSEKVLPALSKDRALARAIEKDSERVEPTMGGFRAQSAVDATQTMRAGRVEPRIGTEFVAPDRPGRVEPTIGTGTVTEPAGRVEPTMGGQPPPAAPQQRPGEPEAVPGMPTGDEVEELPVTPVTGTAPATPTAPTTAAPAFTVPQAFKYYVTQGPAYEGLEPLAIDDADFELEVLERQAKKGRLTPETFASSEIGKRIDTATIAAINDAIRADPLSAIQTLRAAIAGPAAATPSVTPVTGAAPTQEPATGELPFTPTGKGPKFKGSVAPTQAAARLPDTPTVAPVKPVKPFEPAAPQHKAADLPSVDVPLKMLKLSEDVPQFKYGADKKGVVKPLGGKFSREGLAPIAVWHRLDGSLEVISGRHRFDLAKRSGEETIPAQVYYESEGFTAMDAAIKDAELNIRDDQGQVKDYVNYFKESGMDRQTAESKGFLARDKGKRGFTIGNQGSDELIESLRADEITDNDAFYIALNAPNDPKIQAVGMKAVRDGKSINVATNLMQAVKVMSSGGLRGTTLDIFGDDTKALEEAAAMADYAAKKQREVQNRLSAISGAAKRPDIAKAEGINVNDLDAVKRRVEELRQLKAKWDKWSTNSEAISEIREAIGATPFELTSESETERQAREEKETAEREEKERKEIADREVDLFGLTAPPAEEKVAPTGDMFTGENAPSGSYQAAYEVLRRASERLAKADSAYRNNEISKEELDAVKAEYEREGEKFSETIRKLNKPTEPTETKEEPAKKPLKAKAEKPAAKPKAVEPPRIRQARKEMEGAANTPGKVLTPAELSRRKDLLAFEKKQQAEAMEAAGEKAVNGKPVDPDLPAKNRLVLMPCCDTKGDAKAPALELYKGVFFQTLKRNQKSGAEPNIVILSAKHGFIEPTKEIEPYDQVMTPERAEEFLLTLQRDMDSIDWPDGIKDVLIVGGKQYQRVMRAAVARLQEDGVISKDASINVTSGGIGDQRSQLGKYLQAIPADPSVTENKPNEEDSGFRGASDEEVADVAEAFDKAQEAADESVTRVFDAPKKSEVVRLEDKTRVYVKDAGYMTVAQAKKRIAEWKEHAAAQGKTNRNADKIVLSLFDKTGEWSKPWEEAGYQVYRFDIQTDPEFGDVTKFSRQFFDDMYGSFDGNDIYAILAACPCTDFASSGARHFAAKDADGRTIESVQLVRHTLATIEHFKPSIWAIENPVGRIEKLTGLPPWRLSFNPNHLGDPYTKKTLLWGRFNADLPLAPVEPTEGSKMHMMYGGKSAETKNARSVTPEGFAYSFFMANNAVDHPVMGIANKYDMMDRGVFQKALDAGMSELQISDVIDDFYYDQEYKEAEQALDAKIKSLKEEKAAPAKKPAAKRAAKPVEPEAKKETEEEKANREIAEVHAKNIGGVVVWQKGRYALVRGYSDWTGDPVYGPTFGTIRSRLDVENRFEKFTGAHVPADIKQEMIAAKQKAEQEAAEKHKANPFIKFVDGVAISESISPEIEGIIREWKKLLKLDVPIYIATIEDARLHKNDYTGPHRAIGSGTLGNELGSTRRMADGSHYILFTKSTSPTFMLETLAHELGHIHKKVVYDKASPEEQQALKDAHQKFLDTHKTKTAQEVVNSMRGRATGQRRVKAAPTQKGEELPDYWRKFDEWYSDQTARWALSNKAPVTVVEKFFKRLGNQLRRFYQQLKARKYLPDETFAQYMDRVTAQPPVLTPDADDTEYFMATDTGAASSMSANLDTGEPSLAQQEGDLIFGRPAIREEKIKEYAKLRAALARVPRAVAEGKASIDMQRNTTELMQAVRDLQTEIKITKPRLDSAEQFLAKALKEYDAGNISKDVLDVINAAYQKYPELLEGLLLRVRSEPNRGMAVGGFDPWNRIILLYKGGSGATDPSTIRHEIAHALEQMMTPEQRSAVVQAWGKAFARAIKKHPDAAHQKYFNAVFDFLDSPTERSYRKAQSALPSYDMYQFINPSEFWAVNAESLMGAQLGTAWDKFKRGIRRAWEGIKKVLGFDNRSDIHKVFAQVMGGSRERVTKLMARDIVSLADTKFRTLENIDEERRLMERYSRPHTPMLDNTPVLTFLTNTYTNGKDFVTDAVTSPIQTAAAAERKVTDGLLSARNLTAWYGAGLESRDFARYQGQLRTSADIVTSSVALDNAIRSGNIGVEVIFSGGLEYNARMGNFVAVKRDKGMRGVYEAEAAIKKRLGNQLGTDIVQGYLEAKRSISIMDELRDRTAALENAEQNLEALEAMMALPEDIAQAKKEVDDLKVDLEAINKAASSVNMSEEEMYEFAALDAKHPELRTLMDNWTAVNQDLLRVWRQVGLISQGRYETLSAIKDYVPWYRIMSDDEDIHSAGQAVQSTTRSLVNIGREKLFKSGRPRNVVDITATAGQKDFKIRPTSVVRVRVNGKLVKSKLVTATPDGNVHIEMDLNDGDLVTFTTNREIQNIVDNMTRNVMRMTMNGIRQFASNRIVLDYAVRNNDGKIRVYPSVNPEEGKFNWMVNGKKVVVQIQDPLVVASIYGMENINLRMWEPLAAVANLLRRSVTLSGVFQVNQVFKDAPTAALVTGVRNPIALIGGVWKGFLTSLIQPGMKKAGVDVEPVIDILKAAGIGGFHSPARTPEAEIKRRLGIMNRNVYSAVIKTLDHIGDSSDMAQRVAVYKRVMAETGDEMQALYQAANVINFMHHGSAGFAQAAVKTVPFLGAWMNSTDVLLNSIQGGGLKGMSRKKAIARLAVAATTLSTLTLLYCMLAGGDPEYDELDDQTKLRIIMIPGTDIKMPINTSAALIFKAIPELIYNKITRDGTKNEHDARRLRRALAEFARDALLGPEPIPAGVKTLVEVGINHSFFTGRQITPESLKDVEAAQQYVASTSELGKKLSAMTAIPGTDKRVLNPMDADHIVRGLFGTAGAMAQWVSNSIESSTRPAPTPREMPITGSFKRDEVPRGNEDLFYDLKDVVLKKHNTFEKLIERGDRKEAEEYLAKNRRLIAMYEYITEADAELKEVNAEIKRLGESKGIPLTPQERRDRLTKFQEVRNKILSPVKKIRQVAFSESE
jgi:hypothetical protein